MGKKISKFNIQKIKEEVTHDVLGGFVKLWKQHIMCKKTPNVPLESETIILVDYAFLKLL